MSTMTQKDGLSRYRQREGPPAPAHSGSSRHLGEHRSSLPFLSLPFFSLSFLPSLILPFQSVLPATVIRQDYSQMALGHSWALRRASLLPPGSLGRLCEDPTYERNLLQRKLKKKPTQNTNTMNPLTCPQFLTLLNLFQRS